MKLRRENPTKKTPYGVLKWGGQWDSNPRIMEPQSMVLTA